jgi:hypothetical protein
MRQHCNILGPIWGFVVVAAIVVVFGVVPIVCGHEVPDPPEDTVCHCHCPHTHCCDEPGHHSTACECHHHCPEQCDCASDGEPNPPAPSAAAPADEQPRDPKSYRKGTFLLGAFWIGQFNTSVTLRTEDVPIGIFIDLESDLGLTDSVVVPRGMFSYRFSRRHQLNLGYFRIQRDRTVRFEEELEIGDEVFPIGVNVRAWTDFAIYKAAYTWLFYDRDKVVLGATFGLNIIDFDIGLSAESTIPGVGVIRESAGATAPLPILGLRLAYRATPKINLAVTADTLLVEYDKYSGTFLDVYAIVSWRFAEHFSVGGGINFANIDVNLDEEWVGSFRHHYRGVSVFMGAHF